MLFARKAEGEIPLSFLQMQAPLPGWGAPLTMARRLSGEMSLAQRHLPRTPTRNVGGFRNSPHAPLKRPKRGACEPLLWKPPRGSGSGIRRAECPQLPRIFFRNSTCGDAVVRIKKPSAAGRRVPNFVGTSNQQLPQQAKRCPRGTEFAPKHFSFAGRGIFF